MTSREAMDRAGDLAARLRDAISQVTREGIDPGPVPVGKIGKRIEVTLAWAGERGWQGDSGEPLASSTR